MICYDLYKINAEFIMLKKDDKVISFFYHVFNLFIFIVERLLLTVQYSEINIKKFLSLVTLLINQCKYFASMTMMNLVLLDGRYLFFLCLYARAHFLNQGK